MPAALGFAPALSYRDRTSELHSIAESLRRSQSATNWRPGALNGSVDAPARLQAAPSSGSVHSEFNKRASRIGLSIHQTSQKLANLTKLAKRTSMFDDPAAEIQDLTAVIKQDITALNAAISDLQLLRDARIESAATRSKHSSEHSTTVVDNLKSRLMNTTKEFKDVLTLRTESLKVHENRRLLFTATPTPSKGAASAFAKQPPLSTPTSSNPRAPGSNSAGNGPSTSTGTADYAWANGASPDRKLFKPRNTSGGSQWRRVSNADGGATSGMAQGQMSQQQQLIVPVQDSYMNSRAEALQNVEATIVELSNIFSQLAVMVAQQGEVAIRIDENMEDSLVNVEGAQGALLKHLNSISSNRALIIKIFFVLVVFMLIFVVFVA